jgi:predicted nuclease with TOPRIM domain
MVEPISVGLGLFSAIAGAGATYGVTKRRLDELEKDTEKHEEQLRDLPLQVARLESKVDMLISMTARHIAAPAAPVPPIPGGPV